MARMHSGKRGKSGSTKPSKKTVPTWFRYNKNEVELLIVKFAKEGKSTSQIGLILRDSYGVPDVKTVIGKKIAYVLKEKKLAGKLPEDLMNLIKRFIKIKTHLDAYRQDMAAKRGLLLTDAKIKRLVKYYKRTKRLPINWKFDQTQAKLYLE